MQEVISLTCLIAFLQISHSCGAFDIIKGLYWGQIGSTDNGPCSTFLPLDPFVNSSLLHWNYKVFGAKTGLLFHIDSQLSVSSHCTKFWILDYNSSFFFQPFWPISPYCSFPSHLKQIPHNKTCLLRRCRLLPARARQAGEIQDLCQCCPHRLYTAVPHTGSRLMKTGFAFQCWQKASQPQPICINQRHKQRMWAEHLPSVGSQPTLRSVHRIYSVRLPRCSRSSCHEMLLLTSSQWPRRGRKCDIQFSILTHLPKKVIQEGQRWDKAQVGAEDARRLHLSSPVLQCQQGQGNRRKQQTSG